MNIDKKRFLYLLNNYRSLTNKETAELVVLQKHFPYSQAIRNMTTWGAYHNDLPNRKAQLHIATIYATDRKLLKTLITSPPIERRTVTQSPQKTYIQPQTVEKTNLSIPIDPKIDKMLEYLPKELIELKKRREQFEQIVKSIKKNKDSERTTHRVKSKTTTVRKRVATKKVSKKKTLKKSPKKPAGIATKKQALLKQARKKAVKKTIVRKKTAKKATVKKEVAHKPVKKNASQKKKPIKRKISPIKTGTAKKIKSKRTSQQEQQKTIDKFILTKPKITKVNPTTTELDDLSKMSHVLNKRAISETLVQVLIAQGKKNEAIEILKKLIWKTPQKKAKFLAQIKALESLP